jgi:hypothetical protein
MEPVSSWLENNNKLSGEALRRARILHADKTDNTQLYISLPLVDFQTCTKAFVA